MAHPMGAPLSLLRVVDLTRLPWSGQFGGAMEYDAFGLSVITEVRHGPTSRILIATTRPADLVVTASHGRSGMPRCLLWTVAEEILRHASIPVLLVMAPEPEIARVEASLAMVNAS